MKRIGCGFLLLSLFFTNNAASQQVQPEQDRDTAVFYLAEVRVETARLGVGGVPLARVPFGAQVVTGDELRRERHLTVADILLQLPGVSTADVLGSRFNPM